jgi:hypothetical protein
MRLAGDGPALSDQGDAVFAQCDFTADEHHCGVGVLRQASPIVNFDLLMTLGQGRDVHYDLSNIVTISIDDHRGNLAGRMQTSEISSLFWPDSLQAFDAKTGAALCGLTLTADSGAAWGAIPACQGGGGGGGGGGAGGVPEPSAWALTIAGFGLAGAALRRRAGALAAR